MRDDEDVDELCMDEDLENDSSVKDRIRDVLNTRLLAKKKLDCDQKPDEISSVLDPEIMMRPGVILTADQRCLAELSRLVYNEYPIQINYDSSWTHMDNNYARDRLIEFLRRVEIKLFKQKPNQEENKHMSENNETLNKFKKLIKDPETERDEAEELKKYVIDEFPKGDADFDYLKLDDSVETDKILYRLREFGVIEDLKFSIESKNKKISATIDTDEDFNEYKEVLDSIFIKGNTNISWVTNDLGSVTKEFQNEDDAEDPCLENDYILVYSHKLNKFRIYTPKEFEFAWASTYDKLYEDDDEGNEPEAVVETSKKTSNSNCISWT